MLGVGGSGTGSVRKSHKNECIITESLTGAYAGFPRFLETPLGGPYLIINIMGGIHTEEVGHIITCTALRQSRNTWPLQPADSADHNLRASQSIHTEECPFNNNSIT